MTGSAAFLADHGLKAQKPLKSLREAADLAKGEIGLVTVAVAEGFETGDLAIISEEDILGERLTRPKRSKKRAKDFITELTSLKAGDIVVHVDHGIGRFVALNTITVAGAPHDCLEIHYAGGDKLFLPVENIELLTRYGSEDTEAQPRSARRRRMAGAQGQAEEAHPRYGAGADQDRGATHDARGPAPCAAGGRLRGVRRALSL